MRSEEKSTHDISAAAIARRVELSEAHAYEQMMRGVTHNIAERYGLSCQRVGSAVALFANGFGKSLILNRVIGLGVCESVTRDDLELIDILYAEGKASIYALEISPTSGPSDLPSTLKARGFFRFKQTAMLHRRVELIAQPSCALSIGRARPDQAAVFGAICVEVFGLDEPIRSLLAATFSGPDWQHWLAFDGEDAVGAAITHIAGDVAWFGWVGTLPSHRGRGVQSALTAAQLQGAYDSGCRWVTLETATGTADQPNQSYRNYCRLGWTVAHHRAVYVYRGRRSLA